LATWFPCGRGRTLFILGSNVKVTITINRIFDNRMWPSLVKIQYTELKLSCGNDPVVKNSIYSNGDLDLWPNDPKINRVLPFYFGVIRSKVKVTITINKIVDNRVVSAW
jgi:hypothetical protein